MSDTMVYTTYAKVDGVDRPQYGKAPGFDFNKLNIQKLESKNGGMFGKCKYMLPNNQLGDAQLQLPIRKTPFGFSSFENKKKPGEFDTSMSINTDPNDDFGKWCTDYLEAEAIKYVHKHSVEFFKVQHSLEVIKALSNGIIRYATDAVKAAANPPTFKASINEKKIKSTDKNIPDASYAPKQYWPQCEDVNKVPVDITTVRYGSMVRMIVKMVNFYIVNGKWGFSWNLVKCIVMRPGGNENVQVNPDAYPDEAGYKVAPAPPAEPEWNEEMEESIKRAEENHKREREIASVAEAEKEPSESEQEEKVTKKKKTTNKKK